MARRKSLRDLSNQATRLAFNTSSASRVQRIVSTYQRYRGNLQRRTGLTFRANGRFNSNADRRYSHSTYMGLANG